MPYLWASDVMYGAFASSITLDGEWFSSMITKTCSNACPPAFGPVFPAAVAAMTPTESRAAATAVSNVLLIRFPLGFLVTGEGWQNEGRLSAAFVPVRSARAP